MQALRHSALTAAILTRTPGPVRQKLNPREPIVIDSQHWQTWLEGNDNLPLATPWRDYAFVVELA